MDELEEITEKLKKLESVKIAILFGSHAKGKPRPDSDIDICVIAENDDALSLSSKKIDISLFDRLPVVVKYHVFRDGKILFCKDEILLTKTKFWALTHYLDEKYWRDKATAKVLS